MAILCISTFFFNASFLSGSGVVRMSIISRASRSSTFCSDRLWHDSRIHLRPRCVRCFSLRAMGLNTALEPCFALTTLHAGEAALTAACTMGSGGARVNVWMCSNMRETALAAFLRSPWRMSRDVRKCSSGSSSGGIRIRSAWPFAPVGAPDTGGRGGGGGDAGDGVDGCWSEPLPPSIWPTALSAAFSRLVSGVVLRDRAECRSTPTADRRSGENIAADER